VAFIVTVRVDEPALASEGGTDNCYGVGQFEVLSTGNFSMEMGISQ
jgi:hypothetical protein